MRSMVKRYLELRDFITELYKVELNKQMPNQAVCKHAKIVMDELFKL